MVRSTREYPYEAAPDHDHRGRTLPGREPFAGGLQAHVWGPADRPRTRGHEVTLFAGPGSDPRLGVELLDLRRPAASGCEVAAEVEAVRRRFASA